jgi:proteasome activator subunit 4
MEAITQALASLASGLLFDSPNQVYSAELDMEDDDASILGSQDEDEQSWLDGKRESLQTYLDSVPYKCESFEEMQDKLEFIVSRLYIAAKAKNWQLVTTWDGLLQWYVVWRTYPCIATS